MRFLPVLLIALVLLPLSAALKCYEGRDDFEYDGTPAVTTLGKVAKPCPATSKFCSILHTPNLVTEYRCSAPDDGDKTECKSSPREYTSTIKIPRDVCTCETDLCNESTATAAASIKTRTTTPTTPPPSAPLKCYNGTMLSAEHSENSKVVLTCPAGSKACVWGYMVLPNGLSLTRRSCDTSCDGRANTCAEGEQEFEVPLGKPVTLPVTACCCETDLCNGKDVRLDGRPMPTPPPLPSGPSVKCYGYNEFEGKPAPEKIQMTCAGSYCITSAGTLEGRGRVSSGDCDVKRICHQDGACQAVNTDVTVDGATGKYSAQLCCCKGDGCNKSPPDGSNPATAPTASLLSLAAAAAVLAAHF